MGTDRTGIFDGDGSSQPVISVWDPLSLCTAELASLIRECGAQPRILSSTTIETELLPGMLGIVVLDLRSREAALNVLPIFRQRDIEAVVIHPHPEPMTLAERCHVLLAGASAVVEASGGDFMRSTKRWIEQKLQARLIRITEAADLRRTMREMDIIGESASLLSAFSRLVKVSNLSDVPVLIQGESGTGKGLFAQALQRLDPKRCRAPFVSINCAAISAQLMESELFGHRKGSFTGAERHRKGLVRSAEGGTLFLDEIGELDIGLQAKLLRVLQERRVLGVGEDQEVPVDIRIIAATNRSLDEMVRTKAFREDLYHRLNVVSIEIPPLRFRPQDIPCLVRHFLQKHSDIASHRNFDVNAEFVSGLSQLELRGNARELENIIHRVLVNKTDGSELNLLDLPEDVWRSLARQETPAPMAMAGQHPADRASPNASQEVQLFQKLLASGATLSTSLQQCEKILLQEALRQTHGNQSQTARLLGITPRSVYNKLRRHNLAA